MDTKAAKKAARKEKKEQKASEFARCKSRIDELKKTQDHESEIQFADLDRTQRHQLAVYAIKCGLRPKISSGISVQFILN